MLLKIYETLFAKLQKMSAELASLGDTHLTTASLKEKLPFTADFTEVETGWSG